MAAALKILGQVAPLATTETDLYSVPAATSAVASSITVCNRGATAATFRVSASQAAAATANKNYVYYDLDLPANETFIATIGLTLATTDIVRVYASTANLSFGLFGQENT